MGRKPAPSKSIPKTTSPPRVRRRNTYDRVTALSKHIGKNQETLGYSFDTKRFGNSFCLQRVSKDSHFVQKDFPVMYVFFCFSSCPNISLVHTGQTPDSLKTLLCMVRVTVLRSPGAGSDGRWPCRLCKGQHATPHLLSLLISCSTVPNSHKWEDEAGRQA